MTYNNIIIAKGGGCVAAAVLVLRLNRPLTEAETAALEQILPQERRERLNRQRVREKREQALCAYGLLALALRRRFGWQYLPRVGWTEQGKPLFPDAPDIFFNVSHTDGAVLAGIADSPIGVDIERIRPVGQRIVERMGAETPEAFFDLWVRQEAQGKRSGEGIASVLSGKAFPETEEPYFELRPFEGYVAGVALTEEIRPPEVQTVSMEELFA